MKKNYKDRIVNLGINDKPITPVVVYQTKTLPYAPYGIDNKFPEQILAYYNNVGIHRSIINIKNNMFLGDGIGIVDAEKEKATLKFIKEIGLDKLLPIIGLDWFNFGGSYVAVTYNKKGNKILSVEHIPNEKMRASNPNSKGLTDSFFFNPSNEKHEKWSKHTTAKQLEEFKAFNTEKNKNKTQIMYIKEFNPDNPSYSFPSWIAGQNDISSLNAIALYRNSLLKNSMTPGYFIQYKTSGDISDEEIDVIKESWEDKMQNVENAGKYLFGFTDNADEIEITPIGSTDNDKLYTVISEDVKLNVVNAHQINPQLVLETPGKLSNTTEIQLVKDMFMNDYIIPNRDKVLEYLNQIFKFNNLSPITIKDKKVNLLSKYTLAELKEFLSEEEIRELLGYNTVIEEIVEDVIEKEVEEEVEQTEQVKEDNTDEL